MHSGATLEWVDDLDRVEGWSHDDHSLCIFVWMVQVLKILGAALHAQRVKSLKLSTTSECNEAKCFIWKSHSQGRDTIAYTEGEGDKCTAQQQKN